MGTLIIIAWILAIIIFGICCYALGKSDGFREANRNYTKSLEHIRSNYYAIAESIRGMQNDDKGITDKL